MYMTYMYNDTCNDVENLCVTANKKAKTMPRGSGGSSAGGQASLRGAEQSLHIMRQVKSYFNVGMDHVLEVATNMAENGAGKGTEVFNF